MKNPQKTDFGKFIYGYACDTRTTDAEFLLSKWQYTNLTGRGRGTDDVIAYHLRQAFKPGEVTPEEANRIGRELVLKLTKGDHAFVVCTHVDKHHVHNHIIINSTALDCRKKIPQLLGFHLGDPAHERQALPGARLIHCGESKTEPRPLWYMDGKSETAFPSEAVTVGD
ncbi:MAG: relaxase/mobilization nuclease domain-containing protein [Dialister sp.]